MTVSVYSRYQCVHVCLFAQLCLTLCDPMDCSLPGSSVHGISQVRILSELPLPSPGNLPKLGIKAGSSALQEVSLPSEPARNPRYPVNIVKCMGEKKNTFQADPGGGGSRPHP